MKSKTRASRTYFLGRLLTAGPFLLAIGIGVGVGWWVLRADTSKIPALAAKTADIASVDLPAELPSPGDPVDIETLSERGKTTIIDFYSTYCGPCMALKPMLEQLAQRRSDIRLVSLDINRPGMRGIDWNSPLARQYHLDQIPHLAVFGPDRILLAEDSPGDPAARRVVDRFLNQ